jgi:hypothetical protein
MSVITLFIVLLVIFLILTLIIVFVLKYYTQIPPTWPYFFDLKNLGKDTTVMVLVNGAQYKNYSLPAGGKGRVTVGSNITNPLTKKPFKRSEILTVAFYFDKPGQVEYSSPNVKQVPSFSAVPCVGEGCPPPSTKLSEYPVYNRTVFNQKGYYTIFLNR